MFAPRTLGSRFALALTLGSTALGVTACSLSGSSLHVSPTRPGSIAGDAKALARKLKHENGGALELALDYAQPGNDEDVRKGALLLLGQFGAVGDPETSETVRFVLESALSDPNDSIRLSATQALEKVPGTFL